MNTAIPLNAECPGLAEQDVNTLEQAKGDDERTGSGTWILGPDKPFFPPETP